MLGVLESLKFEYENNLLSSLEEAIHADIFSEYLEMASDLADERNDKILSAVIAGYTLEEHLRKLCIKNGISIFQENGKNKKADLMNSELASDNSKVYLKLDQQQITAWLAVRNSAIHGKQEEFDLNRVKLMIDGIRGFISKYPA